MPAQDRLQLVAQPLHRAPPRLTSARTLATCLNVPLFSAWVFQRLLSCDNEGSGLKITKPNIY